MDNENKNEYVSVQPNWHNQLVCQVWVLAVQHKSPLNLTW